ncbi:serine hydrolase [Actinomycetospora lutea]|uniref:serine hydrolase domain-containing protein n=1 Tax=Actinomycetospora lutea TaxID=663604 RepID=UPI002365AE85|nr:serine hydrolase domain-containing protein [Actinomycetospora lutea]MDD7942850.1 serine hydrolase [Actinomycetospora lutea]
MVPTDHLDTLDAASLTTRVDAVLNRWPTAGLAVGVVRDGSLRWFHGHGVADVASGTPVTADTVFRVASITKTVTAIAVMQLRDRGLVDLDAPAARYLRAYALIPARTGWRPATIRHLLLHTAGVRAVRTPADLLRSDMGWGTPRYRSAPSPAAYYGRGLRLDLEPGTRWAYSNHGYAVLGQIIEDLTRTPLTAYLREHVFDPLGMTSTDLTRSDRVRPRLATGYEIGRRGLQAVTDREIVTAGASGIYSTIRDMARYAAALLGGGRNDHGRVLAADTLAEMYAPHHQPDPRLAGMGLSFFRGQVGGHRTVGHDGIWKGFRSDLLLAPDDGLGVLAFANTSHFDPRGAPTPVTQALLRGLLGLPDDVIRTDVPERPAVWRQLCGRYSFGPGRLLDPQPRMFLGSGVEVLVRGERLIIRGRTPIPAVRRGLRLHPVPDDTDLFHLDLTTLGLEPVPVAFARGPRGEVTALHTGLLPISLTKRPDTRP